VPARAPDSFTEETPTAVLVRQVPGRHRSVREGVAGGQAPRSRKRAVAAELTRAGYLDERGRPFAEPASRKPGRDPGFER
jgi:hypothetical protein